MYQILLLISPVLGTHLFECDWPNVLKERIISEVKPYQLTIFLDNKGDKCISCGTSILQSINNGIAVTYLDTNHTDSRFSNLPIFGNPRGVMLYLILYCGSDNINNTVLQNQLIIDKIVKLSPKVIRPKCLLLISNDNVNSSNTFEQILTYAWSKKFLDFSIIDLNQVSDKTSVHLHYYNPFHTTFSKILFHSKTTIFPNKLKDVNKYPMKIGIINMPPFINIERDEHGHVLSDFMAFLHSHIFIACEKMNFSFDFIVPAKSFTTMKESFENLIEELMNNEINIVPIMAPFSFLIQLRNASSISTIDRAGRYSNFIAIAPVRVVNKLNVPTGLIDNLLCIPAAFVLYTYTINFLKLSKKHWAVTYILKLLFGVPTSSSEKSIIDKIIFMTVVLVSIPYSGRFYSSFLEFQVNREESSFDTLVDIENSGLNLYTNRLYYKKLFETDNRLVQSMKSRIIQINDVTECLLDFLMKGKNCLCLTVEDLGEFYVEKFLNSESKPVMKVAKASFFLEPVVYPIEQASPYHEEFEKYIRMIEESNLLQQLKKPAKKRLTLIPSQSEDSFIAKYFFLMQLISILSVGYLLSIVAFFKEVITGAS